MPPERPLSAEDFEQEARGPRLIDSWRAKQLLPNPLGPFSIELNRPPDAELLGHVNELVRFISDGYEAVLHEVYAHYCRTAEHKEWMKGCGVPLGLPEGRVMQYVRLLSLAVYRRPDGEVNATIYVSPAWDTEHGIYVGVVNGAVVPQSL